MKSKSEPEPDVAQTLGIDRHSSRRNGLKRWFVLAFLSVVIAAAIVMWTRINKTDTVQYKTQEVEHGSLTVIVTATGTLQPTNQVEVSSELSGIIKNVLVDHNSRVKIGQILAKLDASKLEAQVMQSRAALESAIGKYLQTQATVKETRSKLAQLQRARELSKNQVPSLSELEAAEAAFDRATADEASARAAVSQARATLQANETDLSKTMIRSPINGIVLTRSAEPGQTVAASFQAPVLFTLAEDLTQMELHVDVDEADIGQVQKGQKAAFGVDAYPDRTFQAQITQTRYGSKTVQGVVTYETVLKVENSDLSLRPGMTATAEITVRKVEGAVLIPNNALRFSPPVSVEEKKPSGGLLSSLFPRPPSATSQPREDGTANKKQRRVWTLKHGQLSAIPVSIGSTNGIMTEVTAGDVKPGMALVIERMEKGQ